MVLHMKNKVYYKVCIEIDNKTTMYEYEGGFTSERKVKQYIRSVMKRGYYKYHIENLYEYYPPNRIREITIEKYQPEE